jgi:ubiquitin carboxyl-terminal hydrolase 5/13
MICGSLGCGRKQYGGVDGNSHGLQHFEETGHSISVKLGTITPEGSAGALFSSTTSHHERTDVSVCTMLPDVDIYCYTCNDSKLDPSLALHLSNFGINVETLIKTEKSMTELVGYSCCTVEPRAGYLTFCPTLAFMVSSVSMTDSHLTQ